ncbi:MAG: hypothetical protein WC222_08180 [Parachlamydiales bacterium]|jgi:hypothetical protein
MSSAIVPVKLFTEIPGNNTPDFWKERYDVYAPPYQEYLSNIFKTRLCMGIGLTAFSVGAFYLSPIPMTAGVLLFLVSAGFNRALQEVRSPQSQVLRDQDYFNKRLCENYIQSYTDWDRKDMVAFAENKQDAIVDYVIEIHKDYNNLFHRTWRLTEFLSPANQEKFNQKLTELSPRLLEKNSYSEFCGACVRHNLSKDFILKALKERLDAKGFPSFIDLFGTQYYSGIKLGDVTIDLNFMLEQFKSLPTKSFEDVKSLSKLYKWSPKWRIPDEVVDSCLNETKYECLILDAYKSAYIYKSSQTARKLLTRITKSEFDSLMVAGDFTKDTARPFKRGLTTAKVRYDQIEKMKAENEKEEQKLRVIGKTDKRPIAEILKENTVYQNNLQEIARLEELQKDYKENLKYDEGYKI